MENDDAFLVEVTGFLDAAEAEATDSNLTTDDSLLQASHQLLAETEELLASCSPDQEKDVPNKNLSSEKLQISDQKRREIRNTQAATRRLRYRQKLKHEKETLRQQESELSLELIQLQAAQALKRRQQAGNLALGAWRAVAVRQLERRLEAEKLQKMLRAEVVGRSRLIHEMNLMLNERLQFNQSERLITCEVVTSKEGNETGLLETLLSEVDALYAQTDDVFTGLEFKLSDPLSYNLTQKSDQGVLYFDSADRMEFPYGFEQAADAISSVMMSDWDIDMETVELNVVKDTLSMKYQLKYQLSQEHTANFIICGSAKRFQEKNRCVFLWRSLTEGQGEFEGLQSDETTWMVVRPSFCSAERSSVLECYSRLVPVEVAPCKQSVNLFMKIIAKSGEQETKELTRRLEQMMVSGA